MTTPSWPWQHLALALVVVMIWGTNFVAIKVALEALPPLFLCALRFLLVAFPAVFFLRRPAIPVRLLLLYGLTMFGLHFGFLFLGMKLGVSAGLASLTLQFQVFVTLALAATLLRERILPVQLLGALAACAGFVVVGLHTGGDVTLPGLICVLLGATSWGFANFTSKRLGRVHALSLVAWGSLVVPVPMGLASLAFEGPGRIVQGLQMATGATVFSVAYIVYGSTLVAYSLWSWLLVRHPASTVAPFTLLVPVLGLFSSALLLNERLYAWKLYAAVLVILGLALNVFGPRWWRGRTNGPLPVTSPEPVSMEPPLRRE